jgi:hypothetical protein
MTTAVFLIIAAVLLATAGHFELAAILALAGSGFATADLIRRKPID